MAHSVKLGLISLLTATVLAAPAALDKRSLSCPSSNGASFTASNGAVFTVECSIDHPGGDIGMVYSTSLDACIASCASNSACKDVSWVPGVPGPCYMKGSVNGATTNIAVWGARLASPGSTSSSTMTTSTTTKASTTTTATSTSTKTSTSISTSTTKTSTSAAAPTSTLAYKRGVPYNSVTYANLFQGTKVDWAYNWDSKTSGLAAGIEYVPMLWGNQPSQLSSWSANAQAAINNGATHLLAFNEPDNPSQANLSPAAAAQLYMQYMQPFAGKAKLGAPAITNGGNAWGINWLTAFMGNCTACTIDFAPIHWYDSATNIGYFQSQVQNAHAAAGVPIWVTEFGTTSGTEAQIETFVSTVTTWMDSLSWVERYSYFYAAPGYLVNAAGNGLSAYGSVYATN